jgi:hypothetical protein
MATLRFKNNANTTLSGSINDTQTSITVASSGPFPVLTAGDYFYCTFYEIAGSVEINLEIVKVTATTGTNWTIARAQEGTTARARNGVTTCYIELRMTAASAQLLLQSENNLSDLASVSTARTHLGMGTMATQDASAVAITGGSIAGVTVDSLDSATTISDNADPTKKLAFEVSGLSTGTTRTLTVPNASGTIALTTDLTAGYQPLDADLTALAALSANGLVARTGAGTVTVRAVTQPAAGITVTNGDGVSGNPTLGLANDLAAVEALATTGFVRRTASETWSASALVDADIPSALTGKTVNAVTLTANATGMSVAGGTTSKTLTVTNSMTLAGTDGTTITLPATTGTVALNDQTQFIGTTSVALNRASGALALTGVSIDGAAGSATTAITATKATNLVGGNGTTLLGAVGYQSGVDTTTLLSPNVSATKQFLSQTGTGTNGAAPAWGAVAKADVGLGSVENTALSTWAGSTALTTLGTVGTGTWNATTIGIAKGGTGQTTAVAAFDALSPATTLGDTLYHDGTDNVRLAGNTTATRKFQRQTGTGTVSAAPVWDTLVDGDIPAALTGKTVNAITLTAAATGFTAAGGTTSKTLTVSNSLTLAGTDASTLNIGAGGTLGSAAYTASTAYAPAAGSTSIVTLGTVSTGTWAASAIGVSAGGTGATSKAAAYNALSPMTTLGDVEYHDGTNGVRLVGNTAAAKRFFTQTGTGTVSAAPGWNTIIDGDIPSALTGKTYNGVSPTANATGFSVAGGTTSKTLTVSNTLSLSGTDGATLNIGGGGTLGSAAYTAALPAATTSVNGYLTSTDWNTFNGKQAALGFTPYNATNPSGFITSAGTSAACSGNAATATTATTATNLSGGSITTGTNTVSVGTVGGANTQFMGNTTNPAVVSFHRAGAYAVNMGLDTDNVFRLGGWSDGSNVYRWTSDTSGNFVARGTVTGASFSGGDVTTFRSAAPTTGYTYFGNTGTKYIGFDGTNFVSTMPMSFNITGNAATATTATNATNATTVGGVGVAGLARMGRLTKDQLHSNSTLVSGLFTNAGDGLSDATNTAMAVDGWWHVINLWHIDNNGYNAQIAVELSNSDGQVNSPRMLLRVADGGTWTEWASVQAKRVRVTNAAITAGVNDHIFQFGAGIVTLPSIPFPGDTVTVSSLDTSFVVARNGKPIQRLAEDMTFNKTRTTATFTYLDSAQGWAVY